MSINKQAPEQDILIPVAADNSLEMAEYCGDLADFLERQLDERRIVSKGGIPCVLLLERHVREIISNLRRSGVVIEREP